MLDTIDHGPVRELRLARPPANALTPELIAALRAAVSSTGPDVKALVISGAPGFFSGGLDIPRLVTLDRAAIHAAWRDLYGLLYALAASPLPIAAAITGHAPAGGCVIGLFCDLRVMAEGDYKIGVNEVAVGIPLPPVIHRALARQVGPRQAERLNTTGVLVPAADAVRIGLVDEAVPLDRVVARAIERLQALLALPPRAFAETRRRARADFVALFDTVGPEEIETVLDDWWSAETQAVLRAIAERLGKKKG
jgi:enoyl-CoA hydratase/carnithine racemase